MQVETKNRKKKKVRNENNVLELNSRCHNLDDALMEAIEIESNRNQEKL